LLISNDLRLIFTSTLFLAVPITFHTSRHTFATLAMSVTKDVATVSKLLNHSDIATTQVYAEVLMDDKVAAVNKLRSIFL